MVPGIGHDGLRIEFAPFGYRITIKRFFDHDRDQSSYECQAIRPFERLALEKVDDRKAPVVKDPDPHQQQHDTDDGRGEGFVFSVSVVVVVVPRFARDAHKGQYDDVGGKVRERVDGIGNHGGAVSQDTGCEFEDDQ